MLRVFSNSRKQIDFVEYDKSTVLNRAITTAAIRNGNFTFTNHELAIAIARATIGSSLPKDPISFAEYGAAFYNLMTLEDMRHPAFRVNSQSVKRYRDFSKTTRTGELAQGISFLFAQKVLRHSAIVDFKLFFERIGSPIHSVAKTPDYIIADNIYGGVDLMECKGAYIPSQNTIENRIIAVNNQCQSGESIVNSILNWRVNNTYSCCISVSNENSPAGTKIHFADPPGKQLEDANLIQLIRFHYASWFLLAGDFDNASLLLKNKAPQIYEEPEVSYRGKNINEVFFPIGNQNWPDPLNRFYISKQTLDVIKGESKKLPYLVQSETEEKENRESIIFRDGIMFKLNRGPEQIG
ncbi:MAG: hypothetical protein KA163_05095 [Bacteroidia bacterium]|nr:hypothetical protein [Bacteroidia bacterium]